MFKPPETGHPRAVNKNSSLEDVQAYAREKFPHEVVAKRFAENYIDGEALASLTAEEVHKIFPEIGLQKLVTRVLKEEGWQEDITDSSFKTSEGAEPFAVFVKVPEKDKSTSIIQAVYRGSLQIRFIL